LPVRTNDLWNEDSKIWLLDYEFYHCQRLTAGLEDAMRMSYTISNILLLLMVFSLNARAQKAIPVTDPAEQKIMADALKGDPIAQVLLGVNPTSATGG
jgi:hypothetical protein